MPLCTPTTITVTTFVGAHIHHRQDKHNPGNYDDCMEERIRLMTAFTPSYAHAYQVLCLSRHGLTCPTEDVACRLPRPNTPTFRTIVPPRGRKATTARDGPCSPTEELMLLMVKLQQVGAPSPAHPTEDLKSCLVRSLPVRPISRMQEPDFTPKIPPNVRVSWRHCPSWDPRLTGMHFL